MLRHAFGRVALVLAAVTALAGPALSQTPREISFALPSKSLLASPARIADQMGLFAKHGLKPNFSYVDSTAGTASALMSRTVDFATTGTTEVIAAESRDQHLQILASHYKGLAGALVLSKATVDKLGVSPTAPVADRLKALNNVLIASTSKVSSFTVSYKGAANSVGAEPRFAYMAIAAMGAALESGAVEGIIVTAPLWPMPVIKGTGVLWLSPARGDLAPEFMPSSASVSATTRAYAEANPDVTKRVVAVFDEFAAAFGTRPAEVKAAVKALYPELDQPVLDMIFSLEERAFQTNPLTPADIAQDIAYMKTSGMELGPIDKVKPEVTLYQR